MRISTINRKTKYALLIALAITPIFTKAQFPTSSATRNKVWTVDEIKNWSVRQKGDRWNGMLLYQGSDSANHHFISRVMDEWMWFTIKRSDIKLSEEKPVKKSSHASLGYYFVDPQQNFIKMADY